MKLVRFLPIIFLLAIVLLFFKPFVFEKKLPLPADTIVGLYHPFRDFYAQDYERGVPFKNSLITDPVRQQYPWRVLAIDTAKSGELPLWNPYSMTGYPLLGNLQSALFYPLNIIFFLLPFSIAWGILIFLQPFLGGLFLYLYLRNLNLNNWASLLGAVTFAFSGFSIAWMEWGTVLHVGLWLPLLLLSVDKILLISQDNSKFKNKKFFLWSIIFTSSLVSSFFAGHLQTFFYVFIVSLIYLIARWWQWSKNKKTLLLFIIYYLLFVVVTAVQWLPTLQLILESARGVDLNWQTEGWFIPWQHLAQFTAPDFFGNPATGNYWGAFNYGEFIGYIGMLPLILALFAMLYRWDRKTLFYGSLLFLSLIFSLPTIFAKIPYLLNIPFISTAQPTRLLFISDFSLAILAALGFDFFLRNKKQIFYPVIMIGFILATLWLIAFKDNISVAKNNLILPTGLFVISAMIFFVLPRFMKKGLPTLMIYIIIVIIVVFDLVRFGWKFLPFTGQKYLFPQTDVISFLQKQEGQFRIMAADDRIFPPNFSVIYKLPSVGGYDPLYLSRYGELIAASERGQPNINRPFGFNRIITPKNFDSKIIDLLGVKYVLSLTDLQSPKLVKVFQEGETRVYENEKILPRVFFVEEIHPVSSKNEAIRTLFEQDFDPRKTAVIENYRGALSSTPWRCTKCEAEIVTYSENMIIIETKNESDGFLVLTDSFYPTWKAVIDQAATKIYRTDYNFRGVFVPKGKHVVEFYPTLL